MVKARCLVSSTALCLSVLIAAASLTAQELYLCNGKPSSPQQRDRERDQVLRSRGYSLSEASMVSGLASPDEKIRALAASELASIGGKGAILPLTKAWQAENDICSKTYMRAALLELLMKNWVPEVAFGQHRRIAATESCVPSDPPIVSLRVEPIAPGYGWTYRGPTVEITIENLTAAPIPILFGLNPTELFSVKVVDPEGRPAKIPPEKECLYKACPQVPGKVDVESAGSGPGMHELAPLKAVHTVWGVGEDFDMSAPGVYQVSLGAKLEYLNTTVCSNVATVTVK